MSARSGIEDRAEHEKRCERGHEPSDHKIRHKTGYVRLEGTQPGGVYSPTRQRGCDSKGAEPSGQRYERDEHDGPKDPLAEAATDEKRRPTLASQADACEYERYDRSGRGQLQEDLYDVV